MTTDNLNFESFMPAPSRATQIRDSIARKSALARALTDQDSEPRTYTYDEHGQLISVTGT